jgi:hypothetical protein
MSINANFGKNRGRFKWSVIWSVVDTPRDKALGLAENDEVTFARARRVSN